MPEDIRTLPEYLTGFCRGLISGFLMGFGCGLFLMAITHL